MVAMNNTYIYVVGKSFAQGKIPEHIRSLGYKAGLLADSRIANESTEGYDRIEQLDFADLENEIQRLESAGLQAAGLYCIYENYIVPKAILAESLGLPSPTVESAQLSTDKIRMREAFLANSPEVSPHYREISSIEEATEFAEKYGFPVIIKPANLVKSLLIMRCNSLHELRTSFECAQRSIDELYKKYGVHDYEPRLLIEEFVEGKQYTIAALVDNEGTPHFCDGIVDITTAQDIGVDDTYLFRRAVPSRASAQVQESLFNAAREGLKALGLHSSAAHVELIDSKNGPKIVEIGARTGGYRPRMYQFAYGIDLIEQELKISLGEKPHLAGNLNKNCAVYEFFPKTQGSFASVENMIDANSITYLKVKAEPGDLIGPAREGFKATIVAIVAEEEKLKFNELCENVESMKVKVEQS